MIRLIKLLFIWFVLAFSSAVCFAGPEDEELLELENAIFVPIAKHIPPNSSALLSEAILSVEKMREVQLTKEQVRSLVPHLLETDARFIITDDEQCIFDAVNSVYDSNYNKKFAIQYLKSWQMKVANCDTYAKLVMIAFEFNMMNKEKRKAPAFKMARFVRTIKGTGDHVFVLIEGYSGAIFAVDPWIRRGDKYNVKKLDSSFPRLSTISGSYTLSDTDNKNLNLLFGEIDKNKTYYDTWFVDRDTKWYIDVDLSNKISGIAYQSDENMEAFYGALQCNFPLWAQEYARLFSTSSNRTPSTVVSGCKKELN